MDLHAQQSFKEMSGLIRAVVNPFLVSSVNLSVCLAHCPRRWSMDSLTSPVLWPLTPNCNLWPSGQSREPSKCILFSKSSPRSCTGPPKPQRQVSVKIHQFNVCSSCKSRKSLYFLFCETFWCGAFVALYMSSAAALLSCSIGSWAFCTSVLFSLKGFVLHYEGSFLGQVLPLLKTAVI